MAGRYGYYDFLEYEADSQGYVRTTKIKGSEHDFYRCVGCWKVWKSTSKNIGHKIQSCIANDKRRNK